MKKLLAIAMTVIMVVSLAHTCGALTTNVSSSASASTSTTALFSVEFDDSCSYPTGGPLAWGTVDVTSSLVRLPGHQDGRSDIGVICRTNNNTNWYFRFGTSSTGLQNRVKYYMAMPINRNTSTYSNGTLANATPASGSDWPKIGSSTLAYTSGTQDRINTPYGTGVYFDLAFDPSGLAANTSASGTLTYTMSTS
jgi:hypothetical protein